MPKLEYNNEKGEIVFPIEDDNHITNVCRLGQGEKTCSYLAMNAGFVCLKNGTMQPEIDMRRFLETIKAKGDNCEGWSKIND